LTRIFGFPVSARTSRIAQRLASVAVSEKLHRASPKRRVSSSPTQAASAVGSIVVKPPRSEICRVTASTTGCGEWPVIAPVSPSARSRYSWPSTSQTRAPRARSAYSGKPAAFLFIHVIGTRPNRGRASA
jgi:hypothetical protein